MGSHTHQKLLVLIQSAFWFNFMDLSYSLARKPTCFQPEHEQVSAHTLRKFLPWQIWYVINGPFGFGPFGWYWCMTTNYQYHNMVGMLWR